jgi:Protein of unknown function (DUF1398)
MITSLQTDRISSTDDGYSVSVDHLGRAPQGPIAVVAHSSLDKLKHSLFIHQQGQTDYPTFFIQAGEAGVENWVSDLEKMSELLRQGSKYYVCRADSSLRISYVEYWARIPTISYPNHSLFSD